MVKKLTINEHILQIVSALKSQSAHVRKLAQITGLNHVTVLNNLSILADLKVVKHRYVGRSKEFTLSNSKLCKGYIKLASQYGVMQG